MKTYDEIKRILTSEFGFTDIDAYKRWILEVRPSWVPTANQIENLSPDNVDCRAFWRVCEELFGHDPVCNVAVAPTVGVLPYPIETTMDSNRMNLQLAKTFGVTAFLDEFAHVRLKTLEIGPGFGSLKNYIETHTAHIYMAVDAFPRIPSVIETTAEGFIPQSLVEQERGLIGYVVSSNVFQHFSARQRTRYFADTQKLLRVGGLFIFNMMVDTGKNHLRDAEGNAWSDHYGQCTSIPKAGSLYQEVASAFDILYVTQRYDGVFNFVCQKRAD
ncbi:MAG: hypothetical protein NVSMB1_18730 [Polyangiales bacterium]